MTDCIYLFWQVWLIFNYSWPFIIYYTSKCTAVNRNETWGTGDLASVALFLKEAGERAQSVVKRKEFVDQGNCTFSCVDVCFCHAQESFASLINLKWVKPAINSKPLNSWVKPRVFCTLGTSRIQHWVWLGLRAIRKWDSSEFTSPVTLLQCCVFLPPEKHWLSFLQCWTSAGSNCGPWSETTAGASFWVKSYKEDGEPLLQS